MNTRWRLKSLLDGNALLSIHEQSQGTVREYRRGPRWSACGMASLPATMRACRTVSQGVIVSEFRPCFAPAVLARGLRRRDACVSAWAIPRASPGAAPRKNRCAPPAASMSVSPFGGNVAPAKRHGPKLRGGHMHVPRRCALRPVGAGVQCLRLHHVLPIRRGT